MLVANTISTPPGGGGLCPLGDINHVRERPTTGVVPDHRSEETKTAIHGAYVFKQIAVKSKAQEKN